MKKIDKLNRFVKKNLKANASEHFNYETFVERFPSEYTASQIYNALRRLVKDGEAELVKDGRKKYTKWKTETLSVEPKPVVKVEKSKIEVKPDDFEAVETESAWKPEQTEAKLGFREVHTLIEVIPMNETMKKIIVQHGNRFWATILYGDSILVESLEPTELSGKNDEVSIEYTDWIVNVKSRHFKFNKYKHGPNGRPCMKFKKVAK